MKNQFDRFLCYLSLLLLFCPIRAKAQVDEAYSDQNDGLNAPFEITTVRNGQFPDDTHWYTIQVSSGRYWYTDRSGRLCCRTLNNATNPREEFYWCFTGDNVAGYRLMNKAWGTTHIVSVAGSDNETPASMVALTDAPTPRTFKISKNGDGYSFYAPGVPNACINDFAGQGKLALWNDGNSPHDGGSRMHLTLMIGDADMPSAEGLPFRPTTVGADGQLAGSTHWYTMTIRNNKRIYEQDHKLLCEENNVLDASQMWAFVGTKEKGFEIYNYQTGMPYRAYTGMDANQSMVVMEEKDQTQGTSRWTLADNGWGGYNLHYPGSPEACWNDFGDNGFIALWKDNFSPYDAGSTISFAEANPNMVDPTIHVKEITLDSYNLSLETGESFQIGYKVVPENASNPTLTWYSNDETICTIDPETGLVQAVSPGSTYVICVATDGSYAYAICRVTVVEPSITLLPVTGLVVYVYKTDGTVEAFPEDYCSYERKDGGIELVANDGTTYRYKASEVRDITYDAPSDFAHITSFKFNNKFNSDLPDDSFGEIIDDNTIRLQVACIGKRLAPSFQLSDESGQARVYVGDVLQQSKVTRTRFAGDVTYTVSREGCRMLRSNSKGQLMMLPFGRDYTVKADFLTDHSTTPYSVPVIRIDVADGSDITNKTVYKDATISIEGGGVFPDLEPTAVSIKGRGNSSWSEKKKPYHIKFASKTGVLGLTKGKHWNLIANAQSMSMMTNAIGMKVARMVGTQAANDEVPVELYLNGVYKGSYQLTEKVGFGNNSLDISDTLVNASLLELDTYYDEAIKFRTISTAYNLPVNVKEPESYDDVDFSSSDLRKRVNSMVLAVRDGEDVEKHIDIQSLATYLMVNELILNCEVLHPKSTYLFNRDITNPDSLFHFGPVWDLDWAYGYEMTSSYYNQYASLDFWSYSRNMEAWTFMRDLRYNSGENFEREYFRVWTRFMNSQLQELLEYCDDYLAYARPSFNHNSEVWSWGYDDYDSNVEQAKRWLTERAQYVYSYLCNDLGLKDKYADVYDDPDGIEDIVTSRPSISLEDHNVYTLDGIRVNTKSGRLPRGIYVINGRKTVIR